MIPNTSTLFAILYREPEAEAFARRIHEAETCRISVAPAAGGRVRPPLGEAGDAAGRRVLLVQHSGAHDPGLRGHAVGCARASGSQALGPCANRTNCSPTTSDFLSRTKRDSRVGQPLPRPDPEFATRRVRLGVEEVLLPMQECDERQRRE